MIRMSAKLKAAIAVVGLLVLGAGCQGRGVSGSASRPEREPLTGPVLAVMDLSDGVPEKPRGGLLGVSPPGRTFFDALAVLAKVEKEDRTKALFVRFGTVGVGMARALELGEALAHVRAKKPVFCHAEQLSNATLALAATACSKIWVAPSGDVETVGLAGQVVYMRKLLVDELHLSVDILQVGKSKGAAEPFTRDGPSPEARASLEGVLKDLRGAWLDAVDKRKQKGARAAAERGPYSPGEAKKLGLIDDVGYEDQARDAAKKATGAVRSESRFGSGHDADSPDDLGDIVRAFGGSGAAPIALVRATGGISMGGGPSFSGDEGITEKRLGKVLERIEKSAAFKAVVLRIDSPGGSALASDLLWRRLMRIRKHKPIVVSVGEMAASGGYYLACTGNEIFADPASIVGSIGVVGGKVGAGDALETIGVHVETFPANKADREAGRRAAYLSPFVAWDDATRRRVYARMSSIYDLFLRRVAEGRGIPKKVVEASAEGKIFTGRQGKARRLVDHLGGLRAAIRRARELADLPEDARVAIVDSPPSWVESLGGEQAEAAAREVVPASAPIRTPLERAILGLAPELQPAAESYAPLIEGEHSLCALPYVLAIR